MYIDIIRVTIKAGVKFIFWFKYQSKEIFIKNRQRMHSLDEMVTSEEGFADISILEELAEKLHPYCDKIEFQTPDETIIYQK